MDLVGGKGLQYIIFKQSLFFYLILNWSSSVDPVGGESLQTILQIRDEAGEDKATFYCLDDKPWVKIVHNSL